MAAKVKAPPKPQVFKAKDGKEFATRAEWRDYTMLTFYTFKDKNNEPEPLVKVPGDIEGQMFDIADCDGSTMVIMDQCEQVQIDKVKNCRIFIGACASSIFIRNCENCTFYTCCRQLRLREVVNSVFYIYSMAEVHIEYSNTLRFAPFNGGYPEHASHLAAAKLTAEHNLWYDIFDHNDPSKSRVNWSLLPEAEYEAPWFPAGACEPAVGRTKVGSVVRVEAAADASMQSFSVQQMMADAQTVKAVSSPSKTPPLPPVAAEAAKIAESPSKAVAAQPAASSSPKACAASSAAACSSDADGVLLALKSIANFSPEHSAAALAGPGLKILLPNGNALSLADVAAAFGPSSFWVLGDLTLCPHGGTAWATFWSESGSGQVFVSTAVLSLNAGVWNVVHVHRSLDIAKELAPPKL